MAQPQYSDVVIIGGGPAGTTAGTLLSRRGWSVTLFEQEMHPRFHIGESLLPKNLPILKELGVLEATEEIGVYKPGADFWTPGSTKEYCNFSFDRALGDSPTHAYQIKRSEFDKLLFDNCCDAGVNALEHHRVDKVELCETEPHKIHVSGPDQGSQIWKCRYVIDASGRDTLLATQEKWKFANPRHKSAAIFTHFSNVIPRPGDQAGNISIYWFDGGWIWVIPLRENATSVGIVCKPDYLKQRKSAQDQFLLETIQKCPGAWDRIKDAEQIMPASATGNFAYSSNTHAGKGFALVGDAYAFVDPVFSSGVYLAMSSASDVVSVVEQWLQGDLRSYEKSARKYCMQVNRAISIYSWFIYRFNSPGMMHLFSRPKNIFQIEQAVISMLAGDVYGNTGIRLRLAIFKLYYAIIQTVAVMRSKYSHSSQ